MYIGHYKAVNSSQEFYSSIRESLDFPTQVEHNKERYLLQSTYAVPSNSMYKRIVQRATELGIPKDIKVD
jgi:16S rRNA U1498 N3-methylase RsmE